jgi:hypothetical protein
MEGFISLFSRMSSEIVNEITHKINDFILEFYNIKFYFVLSVIYRMK